jgi:hypothetical protein
MQDLPDDSTKMMGNSPDGLLVCQVAPQALKFHFEDAALGLDGRMRRLRE